MHQSSTEALARRAPPLATTADAAPDQLWHEHGFHLGRTGMVLLVSTVLLAGILANLLGLAG